MSEFNTNTEHTINDTARYFLENVFTDSARGSTLDELQEHVYEEFFDEGGASHLDLEEQIELAMENEDGLLSATLPRDQLRWHIEKDAATVLHLEAERRALEALYELDSFLRDNFWDFDQVHWEDPFGWTPMEAITVKDGYDVYQYRDVEGIDANIWRFHHELMTVFVREDLEDEDEEEDEPEFEDAEFLRTWQQDGFSLQIFDTHELKDGKSRLAYRLFDQEWDDAPIFEGDDFCASPLHTIDADATIAALLGFLSLRPGDTDAEYFAKYTNRQLEWCEARAEALQLLALELEERDS